MAGIQCLLRDNGNSASIADRIPLCPSRLTFTTHRNVDRIRRQTCTCIVSFRFEQQTLLLCIVISYSVLGYWTLLRDDLRNGVGVGVSASGNSDNISDPRARWPAEKCNQKWKSFQANSSCIVAHKAQDPKGDGCRPSWITGNYTSAGDRRWI